ncbi:hypothetical protein ACQ1RC_11910, partial [Ornithobacterium rhinotracheale]
MSFIVLTVFVVNFISLIVAIKSAIKVLSVSFSFRRRKKLVILISVSPALNSILSKSSAQIKKALAGLFYIRTISA